MVAAVSMGMQVSDIFERSVGQVVDASNMLSLKVRLNDGTAVWVRRDAVFNVIDNTVELICTAGRIDRYTTDPMAFPR